MPLELPGGQPSSGTWEGLVGPHPLADSVIFTCDHHSCLAYFPIGLMERANERPTTCQELVECCVSVKLCLVHFTPHSHSQDGHLKMTPGT